MDDIHSGMVEVAPANRAYVHNLGTLLTYEIDPHPEHG